ncbi:MAG TPA: hypothetical protein VNR11_05995 [Xanthobacteraceae bacterium]|nr:hypothetical protein [Xanthobacteraceae bacterium]
MTMTSLRREPADLRMLAFISTAWIAMTISALAQNSALGPRAPGELVIGGETSPTVSFERCVDVQIGNERSYGCLNERLKREADRANPSFNLPPLDARSPDVKIGNVNEAAVRQQYGPNYGRSAFPYRPPPPVFAPRR